MNTSTRPPSLQLLAALLALFAMLVSPVVPSAAGPRVVEITARRFEFSPAEVALRRGEPVTLRIRSLDVTHGFFQRALGLDLEIEPGKVAEVALTPRTAGRFTIVCDHFCGSGHGNMKMVFVVE